MPFSLLGKPTMKESFARALVAAKQSRSHALLQRFQARLLALSAGDKLIAGLLALFILVASCAGVLALRRFLLVSVPTYGGSLSEGVVGSPRFVNPLLALSDSDRDLTS